MKLDWKLAVVFVVIACLITFFLTQQFNCGNPDTVYIHDTDLVTQYVYEQKTDTVISFIEKPFWKWNKPEVIYQQRVDSIFIVKEFNEKDLMHRVEKDGRNLIISTVNINGRILKKSVFKNVGNDFVATSQDNNLFVKSQKFYWDGIILDLNLKNPVDKTFKGDFEKLEFEPKLLTGISYYDRVSLYGGFGYNSLSKDISINIGTKLTIIK